VIANRATNLGKVFAPWLHGRRMVTDEQGAPMPDVNVTIVRSSCLATDELANRAMRNHAATTGVMAGTRSRT
jgi:hypothetical protein